VVGSGSPGPGVVAASGPGMNPAKIPLRGCADVGANRKLVETYMAITDKSKLGPLLADDVEWVEWVDGVPRSGAIQRGKAAFIGNYGDDKLTSDIKRITEEGDVVVVEGTAHVRKKDGQQLSVQFVDIFNIEHGKIKRKESFGALLKDSA
jgi:uncharacterized protein